MSTQSGPNSGVSPISGTAPPVEHQWKPGQSGNPQGRPSAGASVLEHWNMMKDYPEDDLRAIARDRSVAWARRTAAQRMLRSMENGDLADFGAVIDGSQTLEALRDTGVDTSVVKKLKHKVRTTETGGTEIEREIELHDRSADDVDRILDRTDGKPRQSVTFDGNVSVTSVVMEVLNANQAEPQ